MSGDRIRPVPVDLVYANVGAFFAEQGFLTVIPDYRLLPNMKYPDPLEDIRDSLEYVLRNLGDVGETSKVFLHGHSAGGLIVSSLVQHEPSILSDQQKASIKGVIPMGVAFHFNGPAPEQLKGVLSQYYGKRIVEDAPLGQLQSASPETLSSLPPLLIVRCEKEPPNVISAQADFVKLLKEKGHQESVTRCTALYSAFKAK